MKPSSTLPNSLLLLLVALLWGAAFMLTPLQLDDWQFIGTYRDHNGGSDVFSFRAWLGYMVELRNFDNARLGNMLSPFSTIWRPWCLIFPWATGLAVAFIIWCAARFGFGKRLGWAALAVMWLAVEVLLPWRDSLLVRDYALNYVWGAAVTLSAIWLVMKNRRGGWRYSLSLIAVVIAGLWHEGFAVPSLCGLAVVALLRRFRMGRRWWVAVVIYALACLVMVLSPGMLGRASNELSGGGNPLTFRYIVDIFPLIFLLFSVACSLFFRRGRCRLGDLFAGWKFPLFLTSAVVAAGLPLVVGYTPRMCFWPALCSLIALALLYQPLWFRFGSLFRGFLGLAAVILCSAHLIFVIAYQARFAEEAERVVAEVVASPSGTVFVDVIPKNSVSPLSLYYPSRLMWVTPFNLLSMGHALGNRNIAVVPSSLADALPVDSLRVDSNLELYISSDRKALFAVPPADMFPPRGEPLYIDAPARAEIVLDDGSVSGGVAVPLFFYNSVAGDTLLYVAVPDFDPARIKSLKL